MNINYCILGGNLTRDPELRYTPAGKPVASIRVAVNTRRGAGAGKPYQEVLFMKVLLFGRAAETAAERLAKGSPVCVEGRLRTKEWETGRGDKRRTVEMLGEGVYYPGRGEPPPPGELPFSDGPGEKD